MKLQNRFLTKSAILLFILILADTPFSQVHKEQIHSFPGVIESIAEGSKFIVVNETRIFILPITRIVDEKGALLTTSDLRPRLKVTIDALQNAEGFVARKIVIKTSEKKPLR